jgi:hypothetical protein
MDTNQSRENHGLHGYRMPKRLTTNEHEWTPIKAERTTDYTNLTNWGAASLPAVCGPQRPCLKAWPSLRVRCSSAPAETIFYFATKHTKVTESF